MSNSIKYSDPAASERWVRVEASIEEGGAGPELTVRVRDNGRGVPEAERQHLFGRFFRGSRADDVEGTGLGLSLVRETVESLGARAWAEFPGAEAIFAFALPCRRAHETTNGRDGHRS